MCDIGPEDFDIKSLHKEVLEQQEPETLYAALISKPAAAIAAAELTTSLQQKAASAESAHSSAPAGPVPKLTPQCLLHNLAMRRLELLVEAANDAEIVIEIGSSCHTMSAQHALTLLRICCRTRDLIVRPFN